MLRQEKMDFARGAAADGIVLLKNQNSALPIAKDKEIALFGLCSYRCFRLGWGSGDMMAQTISQINEGLKDAGYTLYADIEATYLNYAKELPDQRLMNRSWDEWTWRQDEIKLDDAIIEVSAEKSDIAAKGSYTKPITPVNLDYAVEVCTNQTMSDDNTEAQGQLPASYNAVKGYVDDMLSTKADKADLDWKLIGEEEVTEADITAAGEAGVTAVTIDFGKPIDSWYSETMVITAIPISSAINNFTNGKLCVLFGKTEEGAINRSDGSPALVASQVNNALLTPAWNQQHIITSNWLGKKDLTHSYVNYRGYNAATGYTVSPYTTESWSNKANSILNCRYLAVIGSYNVPNTNPVEKIIFKFPAGSKISIYGRM